MTAAGPAILPYPGLRPYESDEAHLFFGRDEQVQELLRRLRVNRFLAVVGTSGCGKSSLVRAGLMPALYGGFMAGGRSSWRIAILKPGSEPVKNLASALCAEDVFGGGGERAELGLAPALFAETTLRRGPLGLIEFVRHARLPGGESLLVIVDQFEEVFRFRSSLAGREDDAAALVKLLLEAARQQEQPIFVVLTMRSDFLGECPRFRGLPEAINDGQYLVPRPTRDQIREAIAGPAHVGGAEVSPRLVQRLLGEVGEDPDQLPQLQHALMRTWDLWILDGATGPLDIGHYGRTGGIAAALSLHADDAYGQLPDERARDIARRLFQRLTEKGDRYRDVRRPSAFGDICAVAEATAEEVARVVEVFREPGRSFLMPPAPVALDAATVLDISHESLIRVWSRLQAWVDEEYRAAVQWQRLAQSAEWQERGDASFIVEPELSRTAEWWDNWKPNAAWAERYGGGYGRVQRFLAESRRAHDTLQAEEQRRAHLEDVNRVISYFRGAAPAEAAAVREILSRMADPDRDAFTPVAFGPAGPAVAPAVAEKLAAAPPPFFHTADRAVALSDPALLKEAWPPAAQWLEEDRALMRFRREMAVLLNAWAASGRHPDHLVRGPLYYRALKALEQDRGRLNAAEVEFIEASRRGAVRPRTWIAAGASVAALCVLHLVLIVHSAWPHAGLAPTEPAQPAAAPSSPAALRELEAVRQSLETAAAFAQNGAPWPHRWDLYPWPSAAGNLRRVYMERFRPVLYQDTRAGLLKTLRSLPATPGPSDSYDAAYTNLKAYLILAEFPQRASSNQAFLAPALLHAWEDIVAAAPEHLALAAKQFQAFAANYSAYPYREAIDREAVDRARRFLATFSSVDRAYRTVLAGDQRPPLRFAEVQPGSQQVLSVPYEIPMTFEGGKEGWNQTLAVLRKGPALAAGEAWVFGTPPGGTAGGDAMFNALRARFTEDCIAHWRRLLLTAQIVPFQNRADAAAKLRMLSSPQSPLARFLDLVAFNTDLQSPRVTAAFQPVRVPRQAYFEALDQFAQALNSRDYAYASAEPVERRIREISGQFRPDSDPEVRQAVTSLLRQPLQRALERQ